MKEKKSGRQKKVAAHPVVLYGAVGFALIILIYMSWPSAVKSGIHIGEPAPMFTLPTLQGNELNLNEFAGTPLILRISSRRCSYCTDDFSMLAQLQNGSKGQYQIIAIETGSNIQDVHNVLQGRQLPYPVLLDENGDVAGRYQVQGLPMYYWINAQGILQASYWGELNLQEWKHNLELIATQTE